MSTPATNSLVNPEQIRAFASATGADDPVYHDEDVAQASGLPGLVAPPTFAMTIAGAAIERLLDSLRPAQGAGAVVHSSQRFDYHRPLYAGETVTCELFVDDRRCRGADQIVDIRCELTAAGAPVVTTYSKIMVRSREDSLPAGGAGAADR